MLNLILASCLLFSFSSFALADDELQVGIATTDITPAVDDLIPLGGYGSAERRNYPFRLFTRKPYFRSFRVSEGTLDPIRAKAMYVKRGDKKLLFVGLDVIGVTKGMHEDLIEKLAEEGFASSEVIVSGTHTHSGPGALSNNFFWEWVAMDRFQKEYYKLFLSQVVDTVRAAIAKMQPADLHTLSFDTTDLQNNRRGNDRPLYPRANLLLAQAKSGEWMGGLVNYAVHGTSLSEKNLLFSSDVPGAIEKSLTDLIAEKNGLVRQLTTSDFIFINGAEGDVSPAMEYHALGEEFAKQANDHWQEIQPLTPEWTTVQQEINMGKPKIDLARCVEYKWMPKSLNLGIKKFISSSTFITQIHFGKLWFLTWPGEATTELGTRLITTAQDEGAEDAWVLGLSNDHLAYFTTEEEFAKGGYETCVNFFGATGGNKIIDAHKELSKKMLISSQE
jgi:neutral ceramidase